MVMCLLATAAAGETVRLSALDLSRAQQGKGKPGVDRSATGKGLRDANEVKRGQRLRTRLKQGELHSKAE